jgi:imidazole glycerol phosphate synthase subunit HisF
MAVTQTTVKFGRVPGIGECQVYKVVCSAGEQAWTLDAKWNAVYSINWATSATSTGVGEVIFDGTDLKGAGFAAGATTFVTVVGIF